jgi:hypothetical protein
MHSPRGRDLGCRGPTCQHPTTACCCRHAETCGDGLHGREFDLLAGADRQEIRPALSGTRRSGGALYPVRVLVRWGRLLRLLMLDLRRFTSDRRQMPVLWHQSLLVFAQRYKNDISPEQREALTELLKHQPHHSISPLVRLELQQADRAAAVPMVAEETSDAMSLWEDV